MVRSHRFVPFLLLASTLTAQTPPNIIHILADDIAWDDVGCFGATDIATPAIDDLARRGMRLTSFYAPHSTCTPTRAAILTGGYAQRVSLPQVLFPNSAVGLADAEVTIAELLRDRGYATALIGKWHLGHHPEFLPTRHGFDLFLGIPYPNDHVPERLDKDGKPRGFPPMPLLRGEQVIEQPAQMATLPDRFTEAAVEFIGANKDRPFYLHFANIETHTPWLTSRPHHGKSRAGVYGDAVQCLDWSVGKIVQALADAGLTERTLIVFQSDNGPLVHEYPELERIYGHAAAVDTTRPHALREGKYQSRYEGGCRVTGIATWPGTIAPGSHSDALLAGFDWYHTFAAVGGATIPAEPPRDGRSLLPLLRGEVDPAPRDHLVFWEGWRAVAVRAGDWKLVAPRQAGGAFELYDLRTDPGERQSVANEHADIVVRLRELLSGATALGDGNPGPAARTAGKKI